MMIFVLYMAAVLFFFLGSLGLIAILDATRPEVKAPVLYKGQPKPPEEGKKYLKAESIFGLVLVSNLMTGWLFCILMLVVKVMA